MPWTSTLPLHEQRMLFTSYLVQLLQWAEANLPEYTFALDEGPIHSPRKVHTAAGIAECQDAVHIPTSFHYRGLAQDLLAYKADVYVSDGADRVWTLLNSYARVLDPWFGCGISFSDPNHVSLGEHREPPA